MDAEQEKPFAVERAKSGRAKCKKCKCPIDKDVIRIAKLMSNPFSEGKMKAWHHVTCLFEVFAKQRATTKRIDDPEEDIAGWADLDQQDRDLICQKIEEFENSAPFKTAKTKASGAGTSARKRARTPKTDSSEAAPDTSKKAKTEGKDTAPETNTSNSGTSLESTSTNARTKDDLFREFRRVCTDVANVDAYKAKTAIVKRMLTKGTSGDGFKSDVKLWCKLLLPGAVQRVYNLRSKQLIKLFSRILLEDEETMLSHLENGDVAETIRVFFEKSVAVSPAEKSLLTIQQVDQFLGKLSALTKEEEQMQHFRSIIKRCTANDLKMIIRLIKRDLRINAGPKHILNAVHEDAYPAFQTSRDLDAVIDRCLDESPATSSSPEKSSSSLILDSSPSGTKISLSLMTPVLPMLAAACKSVEMAMKKCPNGMLSEVKYDGERVQVHKRGSDFRYFSRSLKPVLPHKVKLFEQYIPQAFPGGDDLILDSEVLLIDGKTGQPLPFGSLGIHKKAEFKDANVCLFIFDCIYYNGEVLTHRTMQQRREILKERMTQIPNRIMLSEAQEVHDPRDLAEMIAKVLKMGLEGLVLKDIKGTYEPGKRHWLKVKKDYLCGGAMADSADLVVLGAWYGTGNKGGMMSIFLMGCYDEERKVWLTVTKVHTGLDDATLEKLQDELDMVKIGKDPDKLPAWLHANKLMVPDFVARDPKKQPVWEISGAEFTNQGVHTADGISVRFPRVSRIRPDKDWSTATTLAALKVLFETSSESLDFSGLLSYDGDKDATGKKKTGILDFLVKKEVLSEDEPSTSDSPKKRRSVDKKDGVRREIDFGVPAVSINEERDPEIPNTSDTKKKHARGKRKVSSDERSIENNSGVKVKTEVSVKRENGKSGKRKNRNDRSIKKEDPSAIYEQVKVKQEPRETEELDVDTEEEGNAEYYSFIDNDYIEYRRSGSPVNWIEGRKPARGLPPDAKPLSDLTAEELNARSVFKDVRVSFAHNFKKSKREETRRTLKTLGALILKTHERSRATHVIHTCTEIPSDALNEFEDCARSARHVNVFWVEQTAANSEFQDPEKHAVEIAASYCSCSCNHS